MNKPVVSVICPVYNTEKVLGKCIRSVIEQDFRDMEIILVNDGSTDRSLKICQKYAARDERIVVVDRPNGGHNTARRDGVLHAKGEYVFFIDSDDYLSERALSSLLQLANEYHCDLVVGNHDVVYDDWGIVARYSVPFEMEGVMTGQELLNMYLNMKLNKNAYVWGRLFRLSCIAKALDDNDYYLFPPSKDMYLEDNSFNLVMAQYVRSCYVTNTVIYHYRYGGETSKYFPYCVKGSYFFDYKFDVCIQKGKESFLPNALLFFCMQAFEDVVSRIHHQVCRREELSSVLTNIFGNTKIIKWGRTCFDKLPKDIKENIIVKSIVYSDAITLLKVIDEREHFLLKYHYRKMSVVGIYQKVLNTISYLLN